MSRESINKPAHYSPLARKALVWLISLAGLLSFLSPLGALETNGDNQQGRTEAKVDIAEYNGLVFQRVGARFIAPIDNKGYSGFSAD